MPTERKIETVADLKDRFGRASIIVSAEYRGLTVKEIEVLRKRLRAAGVEVRVVKNTLVRLAAEQAGRPQVTQIVEGPTALALSYGDVVEAARAITEYAQGAPGAFALRGGVLDGQVVSAADLREIVRLPAKPVLISQFLGNIQGPLATFAGLIESPLREFAGLMQSAVSEFPSLIEARIKQLEAQGS